MKNIIEIISEMYDGDIKLYNPAETIPDIIPTELAEILKVSNGIMEMFNLGNTLLEIGWIIYPCEMIVESTEFFKNQCGIDGVVFSDDGAGNPFYIKSNGLIYFYEYEYSDGAEVAVSNSLYEYFTECCEIL